MDRLEAIEFLKEQCRKEGVGFKLMAYSTEHMLRQTESHVIKILVLEDLDSNIQGHFNHRTGIAWIKTESDIGELGADINVYMEYLEIANAIRLSWNSFYSEHTNGKE